MPALPPVDPYGGNGGTTSTSTAPKTTAATVPATENPQQWATSVVQDLGFNPQTDPNAVTDILSWMPLEEPVSQWWGGYGTASNPTRINPLNTGGGAGYAPDPVTGNQLGGGLGTYGSLSQAAEAVAQTLQNPANSRYGYGNILSVLGAGGDPAAFGNAVKGSSWASSHYAGDTFSLANAGREAGGPFVSGPAAAGAPGGTGNTLSPQETSQISAAVDAYAKQNGLSAQESSQLNAVISSMVQNGMLQSALGIQGNQDQQAFQSQSYQNQTAQAQQQYGFEQQQFGIQGAQLGIQQKGMTEQRQNLYNQAVASNQLYALNQQSFGNQLNNLIAGYGFQQQQLQQQETGAAQQHTATLGNLAAEGVFNTGTKTQEEQRYGLEQQGFQTTAAQEAQQFNYAKGQLGLQQQESTVSRGLQQSEQTYQWQQLANANAQLDQQFAQLGLSKQEAQAGLQNALTNAGLQNVMTVDQLSQQLAMMQAGMASPIQSVISTLMSASPMIAALVGG